MSLSGTKRGAEVLDADAVVDLIIEVNELAGEYLETFNCVTPLVEGIKRCVRHINETYRNQDVEKAEALIALLSHIDLPKLRESHQQLECLCAWIINNLNTAIIPKAIANRDNKFLVSCYSYLRERFSPHRTMADSICVYLAQQGKFEDIAFLRTHIEVKLEYYFDQLIMNIDRLEGPQLADALIRVDGNFFPKLTASLFTKTFDKVSESLILIEETYGLSRDTIATHYPLYRRLYNMTILEFIAYHQNREELLTLFLELIPRLSSQSETNDLFLPTEIWLKIGALLANLDEKAFFALYKKVVISKQKLALVTSPAFKALLASGFVNNMNEIETLGQMSQAMEALNAKNELVQFRRFV